MDNDKTMKRKSIGMIVKNLILLLSVAITGVIGAWSWFSNNTTASAKGISVSCEAPDGIEIAVVEHGADAPVAAQYTTALTLDKDCDILKNLNLTEVTSDGIVFQKPQLKQENGKASPVTGVDWDPAYEGKDYMSFDLYIRSQADLSIYLDAVSSMTTKSQIVIGDNSYNKSDKGNFSRDCVVGAARVSVLDSNQTKDQRLLWIPRPDIYLHDNTGADKEINPFVVSRGIVSDVTDVHNYWTVRQGNEKQKLATADEAIASTGTNSTKYTLGEDVFMTKLGPTKQSDGYYYGHVTYYMWVEGEDSEARLALAGGSFKMNIRIAGR